MQSRAPSPGRITVNVHGSDTTIDINPGQKQLKRIRGRPTVAVETRRSSKFPVENPENDWLCLSNDGVVYGIRIDNARINSKNIYDPESPDSPLDDLEWHTQLDIPSSVCDLLFEYLYNEPRTSLETVSFDTLVKVTEAAEQYKVQSAIDSCKNALRKHMSENPLEVAKLAGKYGYYEELVQAAPLLVDTSLPIIGSALPFHLHMAWFRYREQFVATRQYATESYPTDHRCQHWQGIILEVLPRLRGDPGATLVKIEDIFKEMIDKVVRKNGLDACCVNPLNIWKQRILTRRDAHEGLQIPNELVSN
ncbi:hypothetical protein K435DRAFT_776679 [Dendrothele bispora CBS 962.96]|uniref:BTB domain-containing protein n=1 Tax=Dendrothele bispora (strain CBS 962.96) TaxID=1314807 RepID=A0A4S8MCG3_DENBC|nr:hypothetical protein K435DRAFT_776679 [Dendrothele bispora CBS 962.96]